MGPKWLVLRFCSEIEKSAVVEILLDEEKSHWGWKDLYEFLFVDFSFRNDLLRYEHQTKGNFYTGNRIYGNFRKRIPLPKTSHNSFTLKKTPFKANIAILYYQ